MKGDFTRFTFNKDKRYTSVLKQQGRVDLDADWNEQAAIQEYQALIRAQDVIGPSGAPREPFPGSPGGRGSFQVFYDVNRLRLTPGRFYVDGLLCELDAVVNFNNQPHARPANPVPSNQARDFIYIDVWQRHVTAVEDGSIREVALGGPDTATRLQTIWQVRARRLTSSQPFDCEKGWQALVPPPSTGRLSAWVENEALPGSECELSPSGGYRGLENRLYRVEIHKSGNSTTAAFKWSRDNGAVLYPAGTVTQSGGGAAPRRVRLMQTGRDAILSIQRGDWVEVTSDTRELNGQAGTLSRVDDLDQAGTVLVLAEDVSAHFSEQNLKVRRWDQAGPAIALTSGPILLEDGIRISFSAGSYAVGDYWTFAARAAVRDNSTGEIDALTNQPAHGILHHYAPLALVTWQLQPNNTLAPAIQDCRPLFPALTDLRASDVAFDNANCKLPGAETVQQALDQLCNFREGACTHVVKPGQDLQAIFDQIPEGGDASICFQVGSFDLAKPVLVKNKGRLKLTGSGTGSRLIANKSEAALVFESCKSVLVRDLAAESRAQRTVDRHLNGVLTFLSCEEVQVESVELRCSHATDIVAACLAVRPAEKSTQGARVARVLRNRLFAGNDQAGILLVDVARSQVEDNLLEVVEFQGAVKLSDLISGERYRARLTKLLFSNAFAVAPAAPSGSGGSETRKFNSTVKAGNFVVNFQTNPVLRKSWQTLYDLYPAQRVTDAVSLQKHVNSLAVKVLLDDKVRNTIPAFRDFIANLLKQAVAAAHQGIVIGGRSAQEVRVINNTVLGFRQGIHVGLSHSETSPGLPDKAGAVNLVNNTIVCRLTFDALAEGRHGIFVGNCATQILENNRVSLDRRAGAERFEVQGVVLHGFFGPRLLVRENHLSGFPVGVQVVPLSRAHTPLPNKRLWMVSDNLAEGATTAVQAPATVSQANNVS